MWAYCMLCRFEGFKMAIFSPFYQDNDPHLLFIERNCKRTLLSFTPRPTPFSKTATLSVSEALIPHLQLQKSLSQTKLVI